MTSILESIENAIIEGLPVSSLLLRAQILGGRGQTPELTQWATAELNGFPLGTPVPEHRKIYAGVQVNAVTGSHWIKGQSLPFPQIAQLGKQIGLDIPEQVELRQPIAELEALANKDETTRLVPGWAAPIAAAIDKASGNPWQQTSDIYFSVGPAVFRGVLSRITGNLAALVAEIRNQTGSSTVEPSSEAISKAVQVVIYGDNYAPFAIAQGENVTQTNIFTENLSEIAVNAEPVVPPENVMEGRTWDVFLSHASEDKDSVARPLAESLRNLGLEVWMDETAMTIGDSLRRSIDNGILHSRMAVAVISPRYISKPWTNLEFDGMVAMQIDGKQRILPIWHEVTKDEVLRFSPALADKVARNTLSNTVEEIAQDISAVVRRG